MVLIQQNGEIFVVENRCPLHKMEFALDDGHGIGFAVYTVGFTVFTVKIVDEVVRVDL